MLHSIDLLISMQPLNPVHATTDENPGVSIVPTWVTEYRPSYCHIDSTSIAVSNH